ncbi:MAG: ATP-dependent helicase HrpB [Pseudomonadota bacterium]|nr:ATP-dependent helicase HrpB [Pseudomonadota bacterium]
MTALPIDDVLDDLQAALCDNANTLLVAEPGAGKTTRVPLTLLNAPWLNGKRIIMLEPRRVAARNAARFMAGQLDEAVGQTVGYRMRMESRVSADTRIEVVTEGILNRMLLDDPELTGVGLVIFDEFHERHLPSELGLSLCRQCQQVFNPDLKLLVMSATLDTESLAELLNAPVIHSEGRSHPVDLEYRPARDANERLPSHMCRVISEALRTHEGDILAFLPGTADIRKVQELLPASDGVTVVPLHGQLSDKDQKLALNPDVDGKRKVILSTNIAESSVTIDGVRIVIDSGLEKRMRFRAALGLSELVTQDISLASAIQRAGRAGRQAPGVAYRLFTETSLHQRPAHIRPEISDAELSPLVLDLLQWGAGADELDWLTPPPPAHLRQAEDLLTTLGILESGKLTEHGQRCEALALEPRLANMVIRGAELGMTTAACELAALLQEPGLLRQQDDLSLALHRLKQTGQWRHRVEPMAQRLIKKLPVQLNDSTPVDVGLLLGCAFPDRIARLRSNGQSYHLASGAGAELFRDSPLQGNRWLVCADVNAGQPNLIRSAAALSDASLSELADRHPHLLSRHVSVCWQDSGQLLAEEQTRLGTVTLESTRLTNLTDDDWRLAWQDLLQRQGLDLLDWNDSARSLRHRLALAHEHRQTQEKERSHTPDLSDVPDWPDVSDDALLGRADEWLVPFLSGLRHQRELKKLDVTDALLSLISWDQQQQLNTLLPTHFAVPSGSKIRIDYSQQPPVLAVKLQEMFGCESQPSVLQGRLPLMIHLLSPAQRPLQVTQDLPHFWRNTYAEVRKDMRGRYPKHPWPEDPLSAEATRFTKKRAGM